MSDNPLRRIYLDHAATSYPKPPQVLETISHYIQFEGASAGRGAYQEAYEAKRELEEVRQKLARLFNIPQSNRIVFTLNATDALNLAIKGMLNEGDHVIVSSLEHNSVSRPLNALQNTRGISFTKIDCDLDGNFNEEDLEKALRSNTRLLIFLHGSNVSGTLLPIPLIGEFAERKGLPLLVDASQTAGSFPIDVQGMKISMLAVPGHKGLLGPLGTGALWVREGIELEPLREGGTGSFSEEDTQPLFWPDRYESGSHNQVGLVGLSAALDFILMKGVDSIRHHKKILLQQLLEGLLPLKQIRCIAPQNIEHNAGVLSLQLSSDSPQDFSMRLDEEFQVQVRPGLHCAPWAHSSFNTLSTGTVRLSLGYSNTSDEIDAAIRAIYQLV
ncbi:MAG: aminotransferase class V-fold PLP-dependent enzyme [Deltaproteobacteria bacterium]|nr:aminotransferase class V-fold PLP-dependent enzyme [Deltaproteobacteria bacterium]